MREVISVENTVTAQMLSLMQPDTRRKIRADAIAAVMRGVELSARTDGLAAGLANDGVKIEALGVLDRQKPGNSLMALRSRASTDAETLKAIDLGVREYAAGLQVQSLEHRAVTRLVSVPNFREIDIPVLNIGDFPEISGLDEVRAVDADISSERVAGLKTAGGILNFSRESLINSDWLALSMLVDEALSGAYRAERAMLVSTLNANPDIGGAAMYSTARENLLTAPELDEGSLSGLFAALRGLKSGSGTPMGIAPGVVAAPAAYEVKLRRLLRDAGLLEDIKLFFDSRLDAITVLPHADLEPVYAIAHLPGADKPEISTKLNFSSDGLGVRALHDVRPLVLSNRAARLVFA